jgi:AraC-like DNA-binding protein
VLVLSDGQHRDAVRELLELGVDGYFPKPLAFDRLLAQISTVVRSVPRRVTAFDRLSAHVSRAIQYVSCQSARLPNVQELADVVGVSASHLTHGFSLDTAMSSKEYLTRMRVEHAKRLLARTTGKLDAIATQLGFSDASHLSRVFRARTGQSPGRFRRGRGPWGEPWPAGSSNISAASSS